MQTPIQTSAIRNIGTFFTIIILFSCSNTSHYQFKNWEVYRGSKSAHQYSYLSQINTENVQELAVAWEYHTGGNTKRSTIECNPIIVDGIMYITSPDLRVIALNAETGEELWQFNPNEQNIMGGVNRGVSFWTNRTEKRILLTARHFLIALDATTGKPIDSFGKQGKVDLRTQLGVDPENVTISVTSPGIIHKNLIILGSAVGEGYDSSPGHIRAYDVLTGEMEWIFKTIPEKGQFGYEEWQYSEGERFGGANAWGGLSLDEERAWVFASTGSIAFDFYGASRKGKNLFANCILALDANTGERIWHFQTVHHDIWDYDLPCAPNLVKLLFRGKEVDAVVQPTKMGYLFILDRETGEPLYPLEEAVFPMSTVPDEMSWETQPIPIFPEHYVTGGLSESQLTDISDSAHRFALEKFRELRSEGLFTPPSLQGSIMMPGTRGGAEWSGASFDPETYILYINVNEIANILKLKPVEISSPSLAQTVNFTEDASALLLGKQLYVSNCANCHGAEKQGAMPTYPALNNLAATYETNEIQQLISQGKASMPAFPQFSNQELAAITQFLLAEEPLTDAITGDSQIRYVIDGYRQFLDQNGYPANKPPWGTLNAINLVTGKLLWKTTLGEYPELTKNGIPPTGTQNMGGCVATAGGLVFVGATKDEKFRAFDKETGTIVWEHQLPSGGYATPAIYEIRGKQYIVIAAGGGGKNATPSGDSYLAFALPD